MGILLERLRAISETSVQHYFRQPVYTISANYELQTGFKSADQLSLLAKSRPHNKQGWFPGIINDIQIKLQ